MLSDEQVDRYSRQILVARVGGRGQQRLLTARVGVMLSASAADVAIDYLAAAGIGDIDVFALPGSCHLPARASGAEHPDCRIHRHESRSGAYRDEDMGSAADVLLCEVTEAKPRLGVIRDAQRVATSVVLMALRGTRVTQGVWRAKEASPCLPCAWAQVGAVARKTARVDAMAALRTVTAATAGSLAAYRAIDVILGGDGPERLDIDVSSAETFQSSWAPCSGPSDPQSACINTPKRP